MTGKWKETVSLHVYAGTIGNFRSARERATKLDGGFNMSPSRYTALWRTAEHRLGMQTAKPIFHLYSYRCGDAGKTVFCGRGK